MDDNLYRMLNQENDDSSKTVYDYAIRKRLETGNSHSPLLRKSQMKKYTKNDFINDELQQIKNHNFILPQDGKSEFLSNFNNKQNMKGKCSCFNQFINLIDRK